MSKIKIKIMIKKGVTTNATLYRGTPKSDCPKTYKKIRTFFHNIGGKYNPDYLTVYLAQDRTFRYSIYRDGCFYPYYGKITFENFNPLQK